MIKRSSPPVLPMPPTDLVAVAVDGRQVILAWTECGAGGLGFRIERADGNSPWGPFVEIGGVGPHVTAFNDEFVKLGMTYSYKVHARNASGKSSTSNVVGVTMPWAEAELPDD